MFWPQVCRQPEMEQKNIVSVANEAGFSTSR
jgi:hypothetical protein